MRKKIIAANWKMNMTSAEGASFMEDLKLELKKFDGAEIVIIPPFTALPRLSEIISGTSSLTLGAQNMWHETSGAFTGEVSAAMLLIEMPELGSLDEKQVAALAGLAPIARQSGNWKGKSFIRGGRQQVRQGLYMPALVAIRFNADLKAKYEQLIKAGKAPKQAITAVMRKLIILANALLKKGRKWQPRVA